MPQIRSHKKIDDDLKHSLDKRLEKLGGQRTQFTHLSKALSRLVANRNSSPLVPKPQIAQIGVKYHDHQLNSYFTSLLEAAYAQRPDLLSGEARKEIEKLDRLIIDCCEPMEQALVNEVFEVDKILGIFYAQEFLSRTRGAPMPYILVPEQLRSLPWAWIGVAHEAGHYTYWQSEALRNELSVYVGQALLKSDLSEAIQKLCFGWVEELFCDLYGVLLMGWAFILSQQQVFISECAPYRSRDIVDEVTAFRCYHHNLCAPKDVYYPPYLLRGFAGIKFYEAISGVPQPAADQWLGENQEDILKESGAEMDWPNVKQGLELVIATLLKSKFCALGGKQLQEIFEFPKDEKIRVQLLERLRSKQRDFESAYTSLQGPETLRHLIAAYYQYLDETNSTVLLTPK